MKEQLENYSNLILDIKDDKEMIFTCVDMIEFAKEHADKQLRLHGVGSRRELFFCYNNDESVRCKEQCNICKDNEAGN